MRGIMYRREFRRQLRRNRLAKMLAEEKTVRARRRADARAKRLGVDPYIFVATYDYYARRYTGTDERSVRRELRDLGIDA